MYRILAVLMVLFIRYVDFSRLVIYNIYWGVPGTWPGCWRGTRVTAVPYAMTSVILCHFRSQIDRNY